MPNAVTSVLADYRGYNTMFETTVIFAAGCGLLPSVAGSSCEGGDSGRDFPSSVDWDRRPGK